MIPRLLDWQYSPGDRLGGGGYAQAYLARHSAHANGSCVIKVYDNPLYANTFEGEIRALQTLDGCPGTTELVAHGRNREGRLCIVTRHMPGIRLDRCIRSKGPLTHDQTVSLIEQILAILRIAHESGLLHKDIKASNVIINGECFCLLDWGVAEPLSNGRSENIRAKQDCVAPECYQGEHGPATDFYALGWLAVHALTGALPYHFKEVADLDYRVAAHCLERPVLSPEIPEPLQCLIANWLAKNPAQRLVGYDLPSLLDRAKTNMPDFWDYMEIRQIQREYGYLHLAARHGVPYAQYHQALRLHKAGRVKEAIYWLERAAASGYALAAERLARVLMQGDDVGHKDRAEKLLRMAAKAGNPNALFRLGRAMVRKRENVGKIEQGMSFLATAAAGGHAFSQYELSVRLANAPGRAQEAGAYLRMAADRGHARTTPYWQEPTMQGGPVSNAQLPEGSATVRIIQADQLTDLDEHARAWDDLLLQCPRAYPMQSHGWVRAFFEQKLQPRQRLLCLFAYQGQRLVGVMPLVGGCSAPGLGFTEHCFMAPYNAYHMVRGDCLILPGQEDVFGAMVEHLRTECN
jgi:eukaryotic-like serine/threonine-protein kinase